MTTVINLRDGKADVYIGRGSKWGNPFKMESEADRNNVCLKYESYFWSKGLFKDIAELVDKTLGCYCKPKRCHGDFLVEVAEFYKTHGYINKTDFEASRKGALPKSESLYGAEQFYLLVAGSRTFTDYEYLERILNNLLAPYWDEFAFEYRNVVIISGGARGADSLAERYAKEHNIELRVFKADWERYGKSAGYKRNTQMHEFIAQHKNRACICFWDGQSKGTQHNFDLAKKYNTKLIIEQFNNSSVESSNSADNKKEPKFIKVDGKYVLKALA